MRLADMHIHTTFSPDGKSSMEEQCIKAIEIGIPIICFTDHVDFNSSEINVGRIINKASTNFDVSEYFYEVNRLRRIYNSIQILIGIEFSEPHLFFATMSSDELKKLSKKSTFDSSVSNIYSHFLPCVLRANEI